MARKPETTADIAAAAAEGSFQAAPTERDLRHHAQRITEAALELDPVSRRVVIASLVAELLRLACAEALDAHAYTHEGRYWLARDPATYLPD